MGELQRMKLLLTWQKQDPNIHELGEQKASGTPAVHTWTVLKDFLQGPPTKRSVELLV